MQQELQEVLSHDLNPFLPGIQYDKERAAALARRIAELTAEIKRLQKELAEVNDEIESLIEEIQNRQEQEGEMLPRYAAFGADGVAASPCSLLGLCERVVSFDLVRSGGGSTRFDVQLSLWLSDLGAIVSGDATVADDDPCPCP